MINVCKVVQTNNVGCVNIELGFFCWFVFLRDWCDSAGWHPLNLLALSTIQSSTHTILPYCFAFSFKNFIHEYNITGPFLPPRSPFQHPSASSLPHTHCPHFQLFLFFLFLTFFPFFHTAQTRICATPKVQTTYYLKSWLDILTVVERMY